MSINHVEHESVGLDNPEMITSDFWKKNESDIKKQLADTFIYLKNHSEEEYQETLSEKIEKEQKFVEGVIQGAEKVVKNTDKESIVLFDIDGTIGEFIYPDEAEGYFGKKVDNNGMTILRPSFPILLEQYFKKYIDDGKIKIGFISTRSAEAMRKQLQNKNQLEGIDKYIDKNHIYSTRDIDESNLSSDQEIFKFLQNDCQDILKNAAFGSKDNPSTSYYDLTRYLGNLQKIEIIRSLKEDELKDNHILCVDDFNYTRYFNEKDCFGVCVYNDQFNMH